MDEAEAALAAHRDTVIGRLTVAAFATACRGVAAVRPAPAGQPIIPQLETGLVEVNPHEGLDALRRGHVDLAVLDDWPEVAAALSARGRPRGDSAGTSPTCWCRAGTGWPAGVRCGWRRPADERWISAKAGDICHEWLLRVLPGVRPDFHVGEFETQLTLIAAGLGIAMIPRLARPPLPEGYAWCRCGRSRTAGWWWRGARRRRPPGDRGRGHRPARGLGPSGGDQAAVSPARPGSARATQTPVGVAGA